MFVFPYCCSFCLHSCCFPSSLMMKFKLSPKRREISGGGKYKGRVMEQTETLLSALLGSQPWPQDAQTSCKCNVHFWIKSKCPCFSAIFTLVNEGADVVQRSQCTPEHCAAITPVPLNHHLNSFVQESFSCSMWLLLQPSPNMHLKYMDNSEIREFVIHCPLPQRQNYSWGPTLKKKNKKQLPEGWWKQPLSLCDNSCV